MTNEHVAEIAEQLRQLVAAVRDLHQQAERFHVAGMKAADADTDRRIQSSREDLREYAEKIGTMLAEHDAARRAMREEIDELRAALAMPARPTRPS